MGIVQAFDYVRRYYKEPHGVGLSQIVAYLEQTIDTTGSVAKCLKMEGPSCASVDIYFESAEPRKFMLVSRDSFATLDKVTVYEMRPDVDCHKNVPYVGGPMDGLECLKVYCPSVQECLPDGSHLYRLCRKDGRWVLVYEGPSPRCAIH